MLDRQDIDALLVSALYGELTPADEARLAMHLESHPGDRTALDDLKVARNAVRESRIFELQLDPPQAVSALLLQEAARRAPKVVPRRDDAKAETWFHRFVRSFIAHPAMAAAATLVLVVGVAGTLYLNNGDMKTAEPTVSSPRGGETAPTAVDQGAVAVVASDAGAVAALDNYAAGSASNGEQVKVDLATGKADDEAKKIAAGDVAAGADRSRTKAQIAQHTASTTGKVAGPSRNGSFGYTDGKDALAKTDPPKPTTTPTTTAKDSRRYVEVHRPDPVPKDMPETTTETVAKGEANPHAGLVSGGAGGGTGVANPTPQQPRNSVAASPPPPPSAIPVEKPKPADKAPTKEDSNLAWAKDQHAQVITNAKAGKCRDAASLAVAIKNRAPDYYNSYVVPDRQIKQCMQYINDAAEKDAERSAKSRPAKRADLKEPAPAPAAVDSHK